MHTALYAPYARYALLILATILTQRGLLPASAVEGVSQDPVLVELVSGALLYIGTLVWYHVSRARAALKQIVS